jgi:hypothetical protein
MTITIIKYSINAVVDGWNHGTNIHTVCQNIWSGLMSSDNPQTCRLQFNPDDLRRNELILCLPILDS